MDVLVKDALKISGLLLLIVLVLGYFAKLVIEKVIDTAFKRRERAEDDLIRRMDEIGKTSLDIKKGLRQEEREELVALRVAVEQWQYFLETAVFDFSMLDPVRADVRTLYERDKRLFFAVRVAVVKTSTYLRNPQLEQDLMRAIISIRNVYYPLVTRAASNLIDIQTQLRIIDSKLKAFAEGGMKDPAFAPTEADRQENLRLQTMMTDEVRSFRDEFLSQYRSIAEQMVGLKDAINAYIYRRITDTDIDKE